MKKDKFTDMLSKYLIDPAVLSSFVDAAKDSGVEEFKPFIAEVEKSKKAQNSNNNIFKKSLSNLKLVSEDCDETESQGKILERGDLSKYKISDEELKEKRNKEMNESRNNSYLRPYGYEAAKKILNGTAPRYYYQLKEIEMDRGDGAKLADYAKKIGKHVITDTDADNPDYSMYFIPGEYHWDDYFYPYPSSWEPKQVEEKLIQSSSDKALQQNIKTEIDSGKSPKQAAAIAYSIQRKNESMLIEKSDVLKPIPKSFDIIELSTFKKDWKRLGLDDSDLKDLKKRLKEVPPETHIGNGVYKFRFSPKGWNAGARDAGRGYYIEVIADTKAYLVTAYRKNEKGNLTPEETKNIRKLAKLLRSK